MLSAIRKHITPATAMSFVALVFAMTGGALAASSSGGGTGSKTTASVTRGTPAATAAKSKAKPKAKTGPRGPAGPKGATGAAGATGPAGPTGATGATGAAGTNGTGTEGKEGKEGKAGAPGEPGEPGPEGVCSKANCVLPKGTSEKGVWGADGPPSTAFFHATYAPISFVIPLQSAPTAHVIEEGGSLPAGCKGSAESPEAEEGNLCIFVSHGLELLGITTAAPQGGSTGAGTLGTVVEIIPEGTEVADAYGTWAVTGGE
jgi:hypothetical protein